VRYQQRLDGEWVEVVERKARVGCCDCGLVHDLEFKIARGKLYFRAFRNERATAQKRRWRNAIA
jgi:hypothetical protein